MDAIAPPTDAHLRRAVSTAYYALFHTIAGEVAEAMIGSTESSFAKAAHRQAYRALDHGTLRSACLNTQLAEMLPPPLKDFVDLLPRMQSKRHQADYDPQVTFLRTDVLEAIDECEAAILAVRSVSSIERRAFIAFVLFKTR